MVNLKMQIVMKKYFYSILVLVALVGCSKEVGLVEENVPQGETVTITAAMAETKSTETDGDFAWNSDETISVGTSDEEYVTFEADNITAGTFKHTFAADAPNLLLAVSPAQVNAEFLGAEAYEVELPSVYNGYVQGQTNALMIGTPDPQTANKFIFSHAAALVKVTYANVPAGTAGFKFEADANIAGTVTLGGTSISDIEIANTNSGLTESAVYVNLEQPVAQAGGTLSFYVPVPTGDYGMLEISLLNGSGEVIEGTDKIMDRSGKSPLTLARADVFNFPTITLPEGPKYYVKVTSDDDLVNGQYLIVYEEGSLAFNGGLSTLDAVGNSIEVVIDNNKIESTKTTDAAAFAISVDDGTVKSESGYYIGQTSDANGLASSSTTVYTNTISFESIKSSGGAFLRYNKTSGQTRFRYYKSSSYTGQQPIALYLLEGSATASKQPSGLAWSASTATASITDDGIVFTAPTLTLGNAHDITYSSSNTTVATVDAQGVVTVNVAGETTIKAIFAGDDTYKASTVEYVLTVEDNRTSYEFETIADLNDLAADFKHNEENTYSGKLTNVVVSYVPDTKNAIIKDGTGSILVYDNSGHGLLQGQTFTGELSVTVKLYYTTVELTYIDASFDGQQTEVAPETVNLASLVGNFATYQNTYVKVENLTVDSRNEKNIYVSNGDNTYVVYDNAGSSAAAAGDVISVVGTVADHNGTNQIKVWKSDNITITAPAPKAITFTQPSAGGSFTVSVAGSNITSGTTVASGTTVTLTATPSSDYEFTSWTVTGATVADASAATTTFTMGTSDVTIGANFTSTSGTGSEKTYVVHFNNTTNLTGVTSYTSSFNTAEDGLTLVVSNFNNNNSAVSVNGTKNNWDYILAGQKKSKASDPTKVTTGTITTNSAIAEAIKTITVKATIQRGSATAILYVASNGDFTANLQTVNYGTVETGDVTLTVPEAASNMYYKLEFECSNTTTTNGVLKVEQVSYSTK